MPEKINELGQPIRWGCVTVIAVVSVAAAWRGTKLYKNTCVRTCNKGGVMVTVGFGETGWTPDDGGAGRRSGRGRLERGRGETRDRTLAAPPR